MVNLGSLHLQFGLDFGVFAVRDVNERAAVIL